MNEAGKIHNIGETLHLPATAAMVGGKKKRYLQQKRSLSMVPCLKTILKSRLFWSITKTVLFCVRDML